MEVGRLCNEIRSYQGYLRNNVGRISISPPHDNVELFRPCSDFGFFQGLDYPFNSMIRVKQNDLLTLFNMGPTILRETAEHEVDATITEVKYNESDKTMLFVLASDERTTNFLNSFTATEKISGRTRLYIAMTILLAKPSQNVHPSA
jgi:hypothetical protein